MRSGRVNSKVLRSIYFFALSIGVTSHSQYVEGPGGMQSYMDETTALSSNPSVVCRARLDVDRRICQSNPPESIVFACQHAGFENIANCQVHECMRAAGYPRGKDTDPATHCVMSIPRTPPPSGGGGQSSDEEEVVASDPAPKSIPVPTTRPKRPVTPTPQRQAATPPDPQPPSPQPNNVPAPTSRPGPTNPDPVQQNARTTSPTPTSTAQWPQESAQDIRNCSSYQSQANLCCNQPMNCSSELSDSQQQSYLNLARAAQYRGDHAGIEEICRQSKMAGVSSSNLNTGFANICYSKHSTCTQSCSGSLSKWQERLSNCGSNCDRSLVSQTVNALQAKTQQCQNYASLENRIRSQSFASAEDAELAQLCEQNSRFESASNGGPESSGGGGWGGALNGAVGAAGAALPLIMGQEKNPEDEDGSFEQELCMANPNAPGCYVPGYESEAEATIGASEAGNTNSGDFNVGADNNFGINASGSQYQPTESFQAQPAQGHAIPNGGGGMPGSGNSMATASQNSGPDLPAMLGSGVNPNILGEPQGGGGYSPPVGHSGSGFEFRNRFNGIGGFENRPKAGQRNYRGLDLKRYLPGGASDPRRQLAGISEFYPDIGPKHVDFFQRVSTRLQTLCKLKRLLDCQ